MVFIYSVIRFRSNGPVSLSQETKEWVWGGTLKKGVPPIAKIFLQINYLIVLGKG